jgi:peroxiredoxin Q/BCP
MKAFAVLVIPLLIASSAWGQSDPKASTTSSRSTTSVPSGTHAVLTLEGHVLIGDVAPDFDLTSSRDRQVRLSRQRGDWVVLVFAPDRDDFASYRTINDDLTAIGVRLLGVCRDNPQTLRTIAEKSGLPFEMLADATGEISSMYGLYDGARRCCIPGFLVLDRRGVVKLAVSGQQVPANQVLSLTSLTVAAP